MDTFRIIKWLPREKSVPLTAVLLFQIAVSGFNTFPRLKRAIGYSTFVLYSYSVQGQQARWNKRSLPYAYAVPVGIDHGRLRMTRACKPNYYALSHVNFKAWPKYVASAQGPDRIVAHQYWGGWDLTTYVQYT